MVFINVRYLPVISLLSSKPTISTLSLSFSAIVHLLTEKVQTLINELRNKGGNVNSRIVRALGKGVVKAKDRTLLVENGGSIEITRDWAIKSTLEMSDGLWC
jgi:predicted metallopeptidase